MEARGQRLVIILADIGGSTKFTVANQLAAVPADRASEGVRDAPCAKPEWELVAGECPSVRDVTLCHLPGDPRPASAPRLARVVAEADRDRDVARAVTPAMGMVVMMWEAPKRLLAGRATRLEGKVLPADVLR